ncbi:cytochrome c oxidase subunit II [Nitrospirillum bahiense]|uniref:cytochrome-c oxidase n=1 Tax=Nitrospirillum amazonense TaxID=28077 RepID=A0A560FH68_9PROT|nr:cytochrome c oxidase subunit II [Nitrospirillum amazonense]TWB20934.1 cytochrome c oxidase subunit 2 [Nitrospirillum amazonense]
MNRLLTFWGGQASHHAHQVDTLFLGLAALAVLLSAPVFILIPWFAVKYRRGKPADRTHAANRSVWLEVSWAAIPFLATLAFYVWSTRLYIDLYQPPAEALAINAVGKQWMWKFQHPGGQAEINELHVPAGRPVVVTLASQDVIHSLFVPALRLKQDVVPGRYTRLWFTADTPGSYALVCAQFCGADHAVMGGRLVVQTPADYARWLEGMGTDGSLAAQGAVLFRTRGCSGCHGAASTVHAPPLEGLYGRPVPLADGSVVTADDQYLRDSILLPQAQVAAGYPAIMPTFQNVLGEEDVLKLVAYIKSLANAPPPTKDHDDGGSP